MKQESNLEIEVSGFKILDDEGNFNMDNNRLANLSELVDDYDATTMLITLKRS